MKFEKSQEKNEKRNRFPCNLNCQILSIREVILKNLSFAKKT